MSQMQVFKVQGSGFRPISYLFLRGINGFRVQGSGFRPTSYLFLRGINGSMYFSK
jgi:hypothetical protein